MMNVINREIHTFFPQSICLYFLEIPFIHNPEGGKIGFKGLGCMGEDKDDECNSAASTTKKGAKVP